jgi:hypothetical protein
MPAMLSSQILVYNTLNSLPHDRAGFFGGLDGMKAHNACFVLGVDHSISNQVSYDAFVI